MKEKLLKYYLLICLCPFIFTGCTKEKRDQDRYTSARKSAMEILIKVKGKNGSRLNSGGSGFLIDHRAGLILTNFHVVMRRIPGTPIACQYSGGKMARVFAKNEELSVPFAKKHLCRMLKFSREKDLVLLQALYPLPSDVKSVTFASQNPEIGEQLFGVHSGTSVSGTWFKGYVNNYIQKPIVGGLNKKFNLDYAFVFSSPISMGASGSMILNTKEQLIGITFAVLRGMNTGLAIPISEVRKFLSNPPIPGAKLTLNTKHPKSPNNSRHSKKM